MKDEIIIYQPDEQSVRLEVRIEEDTVWLTQAQMAELFQTTRNNITLHISNIFKENELDENSVGKESLLTANDGKKYKTKSYNLDVKPQLLKLNLLMNCIQSFDWLKLIVEFQ